MAFTVTFLKVFFIGVLHMLPILTLFLSVITVLGFIIGRIENWSILNALYYAAITATTVGYGDLHPKSAKSKLMAIIIAFAGLLLFGFIVSVGIHAVAYSFQHHRIVEKFGLPATNLIR
jgi:hypothetical protein